MVFVRASAQIDAFEKLVGDIRISGGGAQGREPVEAGEKSVLDRPRLDVAGPAGHARRAEASLVGRSLLSLEGGVSAVRPGERFGSVVGGEDNDRVVRLSDLIQVLKQGADTVI